jgi:hypothetical protein
VAIKKVNPLENDAEALDSHLEQLARKFDRLRALYENFFMGIEKQPPQVARRELNRLMLETQQINIAKATQRFKFQTLNQKWVTYIAYWNRTMRAIESGTYRRDVARTQRSLAEAGAEMTIEQALAMGIPSTRAKVFVERQNRMADQRKASAIRNAKPGSAAAVAAATNAAAAATANTIPGISDRELESFYENYRKARADIGDTRPLRGLDDLKQKLRPQIEQVLREHKVDRAKLDVSIEDGKVKVRARPGS